MRNFKIYYSDRLIKQAQNGRNKSFLELSGNILTKIYPVIFSLIPRKEIAIKISLKVMCRGRKNLHRVEYGANYINWLKKVSVIECLHYFRDVDKEFLNELEINNLNHDSYKNLSELEKEILLLSSKERIILALSEVLEISSYQISRIMRNYSELEIAECIRKTRNQLIRKFPFDEVKNFNENDWLQLNNNLLKLDEGAKLDISDSELDLIEKYLSSIKVMFTSIFKHLIPTDEILIELKERMLEYPISINSEEDDEKKLMEFPQIKSTQEHNKDLVISSNWHNLYLSFSSIQNYFDNRLKKLKRFGFILILSILTYFGFITLFNSTPTWIIEKSKGSIKINSNLVTHNELNNGDVISTGPNANLTLKFSNTAYLNVFSDTKLKMVNVSSTNNMLELLSGKITFNVVKTTDVEIFSEEQYRFIIRSGNANIFTTDSDFDFEKKEIGFDLTVYDGWLKLENNGRDVYLVKDYKYAQNLAAPYHINASNDIVETLTRVKVNQFNKSNLNEMIQSVDEKDAITLWHLLFQTDRMGRETILDKLNESYPIFSLGIWEGILELDDIAMTNLQEFLYYNINRDEL